MVRQSINISKDHIADFCNRWLVSELALFGSVLGDDFGPGSDVDILITFTPEANWSLFDHIRMEQELEELLDRNVDLVTRRAVEQSRNWILRREILNTAETIYGL